jgi:hypothetical protein
MEFHSLLGIFTAFEPFLPPLAMDFHSLAGWSTL